MSIKLFTIILILLCCVVMIFAFDFRMGSNYRRNLDLIILHNNDIHGRYDEVDINGKTCTKELSSSNQCYGGFARIAHMIRKFRSLGKTSSMPALYFFAGDMYTGTNWFTIFKDKISSELLNKLEPDAITLGNHEFDLGIKGLLPYLHDIKAPTIVSNLNLSKSPELRNTTITNSTILHVNNHKIGMIGFLTRETITGTTFSFDITPEVEAINREAAKLKRDGINIIIALGHSGYKIDKKIAESCPDVDLVIGAHSHSYLSSETQNKNPSIVEKVEGPYPTEIRQKSGKIVPVVQAFAFTKYLGYLQVRFDSKGDLVFWGGRPILLDAGVPQEKDILQIVDKYRPKIDALYKPIGSTQRDLNGDRGKCRNEECIMGNLVTDAFINCAKKYDKSICISFVNVGAIRGGIKGATSISIGDIMQVIPFNGTISTANVDGKSILSALELSASKFQLDSGAFLQFSGLEVKFNMTKNIGNRVNSVKIMSNCATRKMDDLVLMKRYNVVMPNYLINGGDFYKWMDSYSNPINLNCTDLSSVINYVKENSPLDYKLEGRQRNL